MRRGRPGHDGSAGGAVRVVVRATELHGQRPGQEGERLLRLRDVKRHVDHGRVGESSAGDRRQL